MICAETVVVEFDQVVYKKRIQNCKMFIDRTDRQTNDARLKVIRFANYVYID